MALNPIAYTEQVIRNFLCYQLTADDEPSVRVIAEVVEVLG